jgi:hypothetical protein
MNKTFCEILFVSCIFVGRVNADCGWADSTPFALNLTSGRNTAFQNSPSFYLNLSPTDRGFADSDSFSFDWLANSQPVQGPSRPPPYCPKDDLLKQYDSANNRWVALFSFPAAGQSVVVLNHGWNSSPSDMLPLAQAISNRIPGIHIYAWHWGEGDNTISDSNPNGIPFADDFAFIGECFTSINNVKKCLIGDGALQTELIKTMTNAAMHGGRLGDSLLAHGIRPDLHKIHMIGHSFGGIVCAEAAKKLATSGAKIKQITTLDTPAMSFPDAVNNYIMPQFAERVEVLYYDCRACGGTGGPLRTNAPNVLNLKLDSSYYPTFPLHFRISDWYSDSIPISALNCEDDPYGYGWSVSIDPIDWQWDDWPLGYKNETQVSKGCLTLSTERITDDFFAADKTVDKFNSAATWVGGGMQMAQLVIDGNYNSAIQLLLSGLGPQSQGEQFAFAKMDLLTDSNDSYIYKEVNVPQGTDEIALDVRFSAVGEGDKLTLSVGDEILIVIDACAVGVSDTYQTYYASVSDYAGQTAIVQIALRASGTTGQTVALVDNLRFTTLTLVEDITGNKVIDAEDLLVLAENWLVVGCNFREHCDGADIDRDNNVDFADFSRLAAYWLVNF